jgi:hypothetical protein
MNGLKVAGLLLAVAVFGIPFSVANTDSAELVEDVKVFNLHIEKRHIKSGLKKIVVKQGQQVKIIWYTDEAVDIHLHGYDIELRVTANEPAEMNFKARATGRYPITNHGFGERSGQGGKAHHGALLYLEVYPD